MYVRACTRIYICVHVYVFVYIKHDHKTSSIVHISSSIHHLYDNKNGKNVLSGEPILKSAKLANLALVNNGQPKATMPRNLVILEIIDKQNATTTTKIVQPVVNSINVTRCTATTNTHIPVHSNASPATATTTTIISTNEMPKIQLKPNISTFSISPVIASSATLATTHTISMANATPKATMIAATKKPATVLLLSQASLSELLQSVELNKSVVIQSNGTNGNHRLETTTAPKRNTVIEMQSNHHHINLNNNNNSLNVVNNHHQIIHHTDQSSLINKNTTTTTTITPSTTTTTTTTNTVNNNNNNARNINNNNENNNVKCNVTNMNQTNQTSHSIANMPSILMINSNSALMATGATISSAAGTPTAAAALIAANAANAAAAAASVANHMGSNIGDKPLFGGISSDSAKVWSYLRVNIMKMAWKKYAIFLLFQFIIFLFFFCIRTNILKTDVSIFFPDCSERKRSITLHWAAKHSNHGRTVCLMQVRSLLHDDRPKS